MTKKDCLICRLVDHKSAPIDFRSSQSPRRSHEETRLLQLEEDLNAVSPILTQQLLQFVYWRWNSYISATVNIQTQGEPWPRLPTIKNPIPQSWLSTFRSNLIVSAPSLEEGLMCGQSDVSAGPAVANLSLNVPIHHHVTILCPIKVTRFCTFVNMFHVIESSIKASHELMRPSKFHMLLLLLLLLF